MKFNFRESLFRMWYWYVNRIDKNAEILFMNYGYNDENQKVNLEPQHEPNRYSIQLYHHLAAATDIKNKEIVEIGCGRGGGLSYIVKKFAPAKAKGVDLDKTAVEFCSRHYNLEGLSFLQGDAQNLTIEDNTADVIFNVESSHRYPAMSQFLGEVTRILRPKGYFLYTDFRYDHEIEDLKKDLASSGLSVLEEKIINKEVVAALNADDERRRNLVKKLTPKFLHKIALNFAGAVGSETYNQFATSKYVYFSYVMQKK